MKYFCLVIIVALQLSSFGYCAQKEKVEEIVKIDKSEKGPLPYQIIPSPVTLGDLAFGTKSRFSFSVFNNSEKPLKILKVRPSCTCLKVSDYSKDEIKPGDKGTVDAIITADKKEGKTRKVFYLHISDKLNPIAKLYVNVTFIKGKGGKLTLSGKKIDFGKIKKTDKKRMAVLRLMNFGDMPLNITEIVSKNKALTFKLDNNDPVQPHKGVTLRAYIDGTKIENENFAEEIFIMTDSIITPALSVNVEAVIK